MANQVAVLEQNATTFLKSLKDTLPTYAVRPYRNDVFVKSAMIAIVSNPDLGECLDSDEGKASLINSMRMAAGTGLSLNPLEGKAALIAYNKKVNNKWVKTASYQIMKAGLVDLALESGKVEFITAETVHENDKFDMSKTMDGDQYSFSPARKNRGEIDGFFAAIKMKDGTCHVRYMTEDEIKTHRTKYSKGLTDDKGNIKDGHIWHKSFEGMAEKTVLKKLLRNVHISDDVDNATGADSYEPEERDITPPTEKGTSSDELTDKLQAKKAEVVEPLEEAVIVEEPKQKNTRAVI